MTKRKREKETSEELMDSPSARKILKDLCNEMLKVQDRLKALEDEMRKAQKAREARWAFIKALAVKLGVPIILSVVSFLVGHFLK